ncbi:sugar ABC transporter ATP-binding protein [Shinella daejeonensis]|nr:sugar ABC transporter ATP-binding protein [Shinella daejeonensis]
MTSVKKSYGSLVALKGVDFNLREGEVMALLGENGAGKSTLVKLIAGLAQPDSGSIEIGGRSVKLRSPQHSLEAGIAYVSQELSIVPSLTVAENICLGGHVHGPFWTDRRLAAKVKPYLELVGLGDVDPSSFAGGLSVAKQQLVEIARMLSRNAKILILDEPTAALSDVEIEKVLGVVKKLASEGRSVIYVTHRLGEVFEIADRVTIFRNGSSFDPVEVATLDIEQLITSMLGRRLNEMFPPRATELGKPILSLRNLRVAGMESPVNMEVKRGEILGFAGQLGCGANAVIRAIAGLNPVLDGSIAMDGKTVNHRDPGAAIELGIAYCSDDRKKDGIFAGRNLVENLTSTNLNRISPGGVISAAREKATAEQLAQQFNIRIDRLQSLAGNLSGGNQQKVALGKWIGISPSILLVEEPTRGVDVGARAEIYRHLRVLTEKGLAVIMCSSDNQEVLGLSDTVVTFFRGKIVRQCEAEAIDLPALMRDVTHPETNSPGVAA